jgi:UDP-glucose 4-epimerase
MERSLFPLVGGRVLVTGASGFVGRSLCRSLVQLGATVDAVSRSEHPSSDTIHWHTADLEQIHEVERLWIKTRPDVVYHLAGAVNGAPNLSLLLPTYHSLVTSAVNLLAVCSQRGCSRLILMGSLEELDAAEMDPPLSSPYAAAKTAMRSYARMCHRLFNTPAVILRLFMCYGPGQPEWKVIPSTLLSLLNGAAPQLSSGRRELDWIFIEDAVQALVAAATASDISGLTLDVGSGRLTSIRAIVDRLVQLINPHIQPCFGVLPDSPERRPRLADTATTRRVLGWEAKTSLEEGLERTVEWYRMHGMTARPAG